MAPYPNVELTRDYLKSNLNMLSRELNQTSPRPLRNHMLHYKIVAIQCGPFTSALITDDGSLLLQGMNDYGQIAIGNELGDQVPFFPEFRKIENVGKDLPVTSVGLAACSTHVLAGGRMFACGNNDKG